jgi:NADP-dependent 3-hydroxy acid dehydrogenase YdfG
MQPLKENQTNKIVLILGANSDVAKEAIKLYVKAGYKVIAASRSIDELSTFVQQQGFLKDVTVLYFDAVAFDTHQQFYDNLPNKPNIVLYAAGFLKNLVAAQMYSAHLCFLMQLLLYTLL